MPNTSELDPSRAGVELHGVWKKFRRGEMHDSLRDLIPAVARRLLGRGRRADELVEGDFWALRNVSFTVAPGEALGIIGPNGAGKSTVLKILTRILRPTRGWCEVRGRIGALIEIAAGFHPDLTGRENIFLQGAIIGMPSAYIAKRFDEIVAFSGIEDAIDTPVKRYSSGMNARLGFAIAAHLDPQVLIIDEVLAVGDLAFQQKCYERLAEFRRSGIPIVFVSHNLQAVASICDRAMLLRQGEQPVMGGVSDILAAYTSGAQSQLDSRIAACSAALSPAGDSAMLQGPVDPHESLVLRVSFRTTVPLPRCRISLLIARSDGVRMFDGPCGAPNIPLDVPADSQLDCTIKFNANLLRGTYLVGAVLVDGERRWRSIRLPNLATFVVNERDSYAGCVAVDPEATVVLSLALAPVGASPSPVPPAR